jgi:hypothetical protein
MSGAVFIADLPKLIFVLQAIPQVVTLMIYVLSDLFFCKSERSGGFRYHICVDICFLFF